MFALHATSLRVLPYQICLTVPLSMTLSDLWPRFQGHGIFEVEYVKGQSY